MPLKFYNILKGSYLQVMVTPQGQQVVVTQVPRPILQQSTVTNNIVPVSTVVKTTANPTVVTQATAAAAAAANGVSPEKKSEEVKPVVKPKIVRDLTTPFVCEWGDCQM